MAENRLKIRFVSPGRNTQPPRARTYSSSHSNSRPTLFTCSETYPSKRNQHIRDGGGLDPWRFLETIELRLNELERRMPFRSFAAMIDSFFERLDRLETPPENSQMNNFPSNDELHLLSRAAMRLSALEKREGIFYNFVATLKQSKKYRCPDEHCTNLYDKPELRKHFMQRHHPLSTLMEKEVCRPCGEVFRSPQGLQNHEKRDHNSDPKVRIEPYLRWFLQSDAENAYMALLSPDTRLDDTRKPKTSLKYDSVRGIGMETALSTGKRSKKRKATQLDITDLSGQQSLGYGDLPENVSTRANMDEVIDGPHQKATAGHNLLDVEGGATQITHLNSQDDLGEGMFRAPESRQAVVHDDAVRTEETPNRSATQSHQISVEFSVDELYSNMVHQMDFEDFIPFAEGATNSNDEALTTFGSSYAPCTLTFNDQEGPGLSYDNDSGHCPPTVSEMYDSLLNELFSEASSGNPVRTEFI
ncbi:uncharacterized protein PV07_04734 [Cladophialophora immunda]|uniref:C2H2-type domain-containing protein n=1 Tax=Cladophialophora immunda TaxID=569365 RepID=A0A0D2CZ79_9EURO|nr:uncharacterized protein PV07_04734 [Cladophialophora immunda]KIW28879.1 hypothetical protein PV07_04734 [Cladophialophora immunda]